MKIICRTTRCSIAIFMMLCISFCIAGTCVYAEILPKENTTVTEETIHELIPMMANMCYDYNTVDDCMRDISSIYGFNYSPYGNGYTCSGNYSVSINNSTNYLNVILNYNGSCIAMYTCSRK